MQFAVLFSLSYLMARFIGGVWAGAVSGAIAGSLLYMVFLSVYEPTLWQYIPITFLFAILGLTFPWWKSVLLYPFYAAWNTALYQADLRRNAQQSTLLGWHSAFWDEYQWLPLVGLDDHLVWVAQQDPIAARSAFTMLSKGYQRWASQSAQIELDALWLERCTDVESIRNIHQRLTPWDADGQVSMVLRSLSRASRDVDAALRQGSSYNQRLALSAIAHRLDDLLRELTRGSHHQARFQQIVEQWHQKISTHIDLLANATELRQEIDSPYVVGVPLTEQQEIFVGRTEISARIEQLLLDRRCPPLLLYGQRRMGKTSLLNNLGKLLPSTIIPMFVDLQGPASRASNYAGFLYNLAKGMTNSSERQRGLVLPPLTLEALKQDPFTQFEEWLDRVEQALGKKTALLMLDEFEALDRVFGEERFQEADILGMLRHLIQHRSCFKVLLSGTHTFTELERWSSYLINVQVIHLGYLSDREAQHLIENPIQNFALSYEPDAVQRILFLTHGHPFLLQMLCSEIVALKNEQSPQQRRFCQVADVEAAIEQTLNSGSFFFADIERNQVDATGRAILSAIAIKEMSPSALSEQFSEWESSIELLLRRELIKLSDSNYRFQVELIRRWFQRKRT
jgi:AAA domain